MTLATELKTLFTDSDKSESMMNRECEYDPDYEYKKTKWNSKTKSYDEVGMVKFPIDRGYAKELNEMGVTYKLVDSYGGEDMGSEYWAIWKFSRGDETFMFKFDGYYQSYNGADFNSVFEVKPKTKEVIVYE
jgi:hypothetical protein